MTGSICDGGEEFLCQKRVWTQVGAEDLASRLHCVLVKNFATNQCLDSTES
jgi:hypothetical protein